METLFLAKELDKSSFISSLPLDIVKTIALESMKEELSLLRGAEEWRSRLCIGRCEGAGCGESYEDSYMHCISCYGQPDTLLEDYKRIKDEYEKENDEEWKDYFSE